MSRWLTSFLLALFALTASAEAKREPAIVRVRLETDAGNILIDLEMRRAPITAGNFLRYVDEKRFDGTTFYRAARAKADPTKGLIQGGINHKLRRALIPIAHEPTTVTGLRHLDATISMARDGVGTAMGDFFITVGPARQLDATPTYPGYAAFGHVVGGLVTVRRILALPTWPGGYSRATMGQMVRKPVTIIRAVRVTR